MRVHGSGHWPIPEVQTNVCVGSVKSLVLSWSGWLCHVWHGDLAHLMPPQLHMHIKYSHGTSLTVSSNTHLCSKNFLHAILVCRSVPILKVWETSMHSVGSLKWIPESPIYSWMASSKGAPVTGTTALHFEVLALLRILPFYKQYVCRAQPLASKLARKRIWRPEAKWHEAAWNWAKIRRVTGYCHKLVPDSWIIIVFTGWSAQDPVRKDKSRKESMSHVCHYAWTWCKKS